MNKFCKSCGNPLNDNNKFCSNCGSIVATEPESPVQTVQPSSAFCPSCGFNNEDGVKFCIACGHALSSEADASTPVRTQPQFVAETQATPTTKKSSAGLITSIILIVLILAGGIVGGIYLFTRDKDDDDDDDKTSNSSIESSYVESKHDSSKNDSSKNDSSNTEPNNNSSTIDLDPYGMFKTSKVNRYYQTPIGTMMYGVQKNDYSIFISAYPKFVEDFQDKKYPNELEKQKFINSIYSKYEAAAGTGFTISCELVSEKQLSLADLQYLETTCDVVYGATVDIKEAYKVKFKIIVTNNNNVMDNETEILCVKIDGKWYVLE